MLRHPLTGARRSLTEWAREAGISAEALSRRLERGLALPAALEPAMTPRERGLIGGRISGAARRCVISDEDAELVRQLKRERERMRAQLRGLTNRGLASKFQVPERVIADIDPDE